MIRDLRASFLSATENCRKKTFELYNYKHFSNVLSKLEPFQNKKTIINVKNNFSHVYGLRLESLPEKSSLEKISKRLNVKYDDLMKVSTWVGLEWWGDKQSLTKIKPKGSVS